VLPDDRDDIEMEIVLKLKAVADKRDQVMIGFLYGIARNTVRTYWRKEYRERAEQRQRKDRATSTI